MGSVLSKVTDAVGLTDTGAAKTLSDNATAAMQAAAKHLENVNLPDIEKMKLILESPEVVGVLQAEQAGPNKLAEIQTDPRLMGVQRAALQQLVNQGQQGLTEEDRINFRQFQDQVSGDEQSRQATILANAAQAGMADSGTSLASQIASSQASAQRSSNQAAEMAKAALEAKRNALSQSGALAGQMSQQQFGQEAQKATAADQINQFNAANRQNVSAQNLATKQRIGENAAAIKNQQQMFNKNLEQHQFENQMRKAGGLAQASTNMAGMLANQASQQAAANQASMGAVVAAAGASDKNVKTNIESPTSKKMESSLKELLSKLEPYMYSYKNQEKHGKGKNLGVMAQDLEKSELGKSVVQEDSEGVKRVDYGKLAGAQLAATKHLMDRVSSLEKKKS